MYKYYNHMNNYNAKREQKNQKILVLKKPKSTKGHKNRLPRKKPRIRKNDSWKKDA